MEQTRAVDLTALFRCRSLVRKSGGPCPPPVLLVNDDVLYHANYKHPLDALERLDPEWERAVRDLHRTGWGQ